MPADPTSAEIERRRRSVVDVCKALGSQATPTQIVEATIYQIRPSVRLILDLTRDANTAPLGTTRIGGLPDLPEGIEWPRVAGARDERSGDWWTNAQWEKICGHPYSFLAQINFSEVKPFDIEGMLPDSGLLSIFYVDPWYSADATGSYGDTVLVLFHSEPELERRNAPPDLPSDRLYGSLLLTPKLEFTVPSPYDLVSPALSEEFIDAHLEFWDSLESKVAEIQGFALPQGSIGHPEHRLMGYPHLIQSFGSPRDLRHLLQIDDDWSFAGSPSIGMHWGDAGMVYVWIHPDDLAAKRFSNVLAWCESA